MSMPNSMVTVAQVTAKISSSFILASASSRMEADRLPWWIRNTSGSERSRAICRKVAHRYSVSSRELANTSDFLSFTQSYIYSYPASSPARVVRSAAACAIASAIAAAVACPMRSAGSAGAPSGSALSPAPGSVL